MQPEEQKPTTDNENLTPGTTPEPNLDGIDTLDNQPAPQVITPDQQPSVPEVPQSFSPSSEQTPEPTTTPVFTQPTVSTPYGATPSEVPAPVTSTEAPVSSSFAGPAVVAGAAVAGSQGSGKSKKKLGLLVGIVAVVLLLAAGGAGAYYGLVMPNQPQKITQDALTNSLDAKKFNSSAFEGEVGISGGEASKMISSVGFEGKADSAKKAFDLKVTVNTAVTKINLDTRSTDGKSFYLKLSGLNGLDSLIAAYAGGSAQTAGQYAALLSKVNDQWFVIDESLLSQIPGAESATATGQISSDEAKRVGDIYKKNQFINVDKRLDDQAIHGVASYHLQGSINKDKLKAFLGELKNANISGAKIEQSDIDAISKVDFSKYPFDVWVSKKDRVVTQVAMNIEESGTTFKVRVALKDINKPVTIEEPAGAKSVLELLSELSPSLGGGSSSSTLMGL